MILLLYVAYELGYDKQFSSYEKTYIIYKNSYVSDRVYTNAWTPGVMAIANLIAFPLAYIVINRWLSAYEYRIEISVLPFAIADALSLLIAILTLSIQSIKVVQANPVDALKYE